MMALPVTRLEAFRKVREAGDELVRVLKNERSDTDVEVEDLLTLYLEASHELAKFGEY